MAGNDQDINQMTSVPEPMGEGDTSPINNPLRLGDGPPIVRDPQIINQAMSMPQGGGLNTQAAIGTPPQPMSGLGAISAGIPAQAQNQVTPHMPTPSEAFGMANSNVSDKIAEIQNEISSKLKGSQVPWFQLAAAFLNPGRTGSFGEALGNAAGTIGKYQEEQQAQRLPLMQASLKLAEVEKQQSIQDLMGQLYKPTQTPEGKTVYSLDQNVAQQLSKATGDPKYVQSIIQDQKAQAMKSASQNMFMPAVEKDEQGNDVTKYKFNPGAIHEIMAVSDNPMEDMAKYAKAVPELRKAGLLSGLSGDTATPFDALALMSPDPSIKAQAQLFAKQYQKGLMDEDKANTLASQMLTMTTSHMDRQQQMAFHQSLAAMQFGLEKSLKEMKIEKMQKEMAENLNPQQKMIFQKEVLPAIDEGHKAIMSLNRVQDLANAVERAPDSIAGNVLAKLPMGGDERKALQEIEQITSELVPQLPRLTGSQSNLDAKNLKDSLGNLAKSELTKSDRRNLIRSIQEGYKAHISEADRIQNEWDANKTFSLPKPAAQQGQTTQGIPKISSDAEYNSIPSGSKFIDPNGKTRIKP